MRGNGELRRDALAAMATFWSRSPADRSDLETHRYPPFAKGERAELAAAVASGILSLHMGNVPTAANVAAAKAWNPAAAPLLDRWADAWNRSFPDGPPPGLAAHRNEEAPDGGKRFAEERLAVADADLGTRLLPRTAGCIRAAADVVLGAPNAVAGERDWRAHVVDDAETIDCLRHAAPGGAFVRVGDATLALAGHRDDGSPVLESVGRDERSALDEVLKRVQSTSDVAYWKSPAFLAAAGRRFALCATEDECLVALCAMAHAGHAKAFLKGCACKSGTWTVDLAGVAAPDDAFLAMVNAGIRWSRHGRAGMLAQEHVPFLCEQRFFVVSGRIVASVCSDRGHSAADARRDRILDERVARLDVPEIGSGPFDRGNARACVDRPLSAALARGARRLVREIGDQFGGDYVLDMGLSDRGVLPIELNRLNRSGPYSLSRKRLVDARRRLADRARALMLEYAAEWVDRERFGGRPETVALAASRMPLRDMAAALSPDLREDGYRQRDDSREAFERFMEKARHLAATLSGPPEDVRPRPDLDALDAIGFAFMRGFEPVFAATVSGFVPDALSYPRHHGPSFDVNGASRVRLCVGTSAGPSGAVMGCALVIRRGMRAEIIPVDPTYRRFVPTLDETEVLCRDDAQNEVTLRRDGDGGWSLSLDLHDGRSSSVRLPALAVSGDGHPLYHSWEVHGALARKVHACDGASGDTPPSSLLTPTGPVPGGDE